VANGAEAVKALETLPYDLVLMDVQMPVMNGLEATRRIREMEGRGQRTDDRRRRTEDGGRGPDAKTFIIHHSAFRIPIIAMTAGAMQGDREKCLEAGMNDYVSKPISPHALAEALDKWLPKENDECRMMNDEFRKKKEEIDEGGSPSSLIIHHSSLPPITHHSSLPSLPPITSPLIFDQAAMMARLMDDQDLARTVIGSFLEDLPQQIDLLKRYLEAGDLPGTERQVHTIKGASANVGGEALRRLAFELEKAAKNGDLESVTARLPGLELQFSRLKKFLSEFINP